MVSLTPATELDISSVFGTLDNYLTRFAPDMAKRVEVGLRPLFDPAADHLSDHVRRLTDCAMVPYPAQAVCVESLLRKFLSGGKNAWLVGEMGTGKTPCGAWTAKVLEEHLQRPLRLVLTAPNQLVKKWRKHFWDIMPGCKVTIIRNWQCLLELVEQSFEAEKIIAADGEPSTQKNRRWRTPDVTEVWILPRDRGKLGYAWNAAPIARNTATKVKDGWGPDGATIENTVFHCPDCGGVIVDEESKQPVDRTYFTTRDGRKLGKRRFCTHCKAPLWQAHAGRNGLYDYLKAEANACGLPFNRSAEHKTSSSPFVAEALPRPKISPRRMAPCAWLRHIGMVFDLYIADECFVGDTPIETPSGQVRIDEIEPGDLVTTADDRGRVMTRPVTRVIRKPVATRRMIRVVHESGEFVTTPNHVVYTTSGKIHVASVTNSTVLLQSNHAVRNEDMPFLRPGVRVPDQAYRKAGAGMLQSVMRSEGVATPAIKSSSERGASHMQMVRGDIHPATVSRSSDLLLAQLLNEAPTRHTPDAIQVDPQATHEKTTCCCVGKNEAHESCAGVPGQGGCCKAGQTVRRDPWRQWLADQTAEEVGSSVVVADRTSRQDGSAFVEVRRRGSGLPGHQTGDRGRRCFTSHEEAEESRSPEGTHAQSARLDGDAVLEQRDRQGFGECGDGHTAHSRVVAVEEIEVVEEAVYDLEVEDTHKYFAGGALVSNCHELKGHGTLQGQMFADLCAVAKRRLMLTGTLVGGYADNLLHLLWRTCPTRLIEDGLAHNEPGFQRFVEQYGVIQQIKRYVAKDMWTSHKDLVQGRGKQVSNRTKTLPGISPMLFSQHLLDQAVFLRLAEMHAHLPRFVERVHTIPMTLAQDSALANMQVLYEMHRASVKVCRCWSAARSVFMRWVDKPWIEPFDVLDRDDDGRPYTAFSVPQLPKQEYPKERRIRRIVKRNMLRGRKTWIFTELTGRDRTPSWDWMDYLSDYLTEHGIRVSVLRSNSDGGPKPEDREEWIEKTAPDVDVIISNPSLVQTGLDLYSFPSILFAYCGDKTYVLRQASRRAWRLGQTDDCEVDYLVYGGKRVAEMAHTPGEQPDLQRKAFSRSVQEGALSLMANKMMSSLAIEGDFNAEGLAAMGSGEDMATQLAKFISGQLDLASAEDAFAGYRKRLESVLPDLGTDMRHKHTPRLEAEVPDMPTADTGAQQPPAPQRPAPFVEVEPGKDAATIDVAPETGAMFDLMRSLGIDPVAPPPAPKGEAVEIFEREAGHRNEPDSIAVRKQMRLKALCQHLGVDEPDESSGDCHRFGKTWVQLVAKRRRTVRERNFQKTHEQYSRPWIAFVEPLNEVGPTDSPIEQRVDGVVYRISFMSVEKYMSGLRVPGERNWEDS
jgi:hypothetical protein